MNESEALAFDLQAISSHLEALESNPHVQSQKAGRSISNETRATVLFRHSGWTVDRQRIAESLSRTSQPDHRQEAFRDCGIAAFVLRSLDDPDKYRIAGSCCKDRFCLPCATERSCVIAHNAVEIIGSREIKFLTLTVKTDDETLSESLDKLYSSFQKLRRRAFWTKAVKGGVAFLELKYSHAKERWHPHLHCLIEATWIDQKVIRRHWLAITGDSFIVDIRRPPSREAVIRYVTKYASKPFNRSFIPSPELLDQAVLALRNRKLCVTFGRWRGMILTTTPQEGSWETVAALSTVIARAAAGDDDCRAILASLTDMDLAPIYERAPPFDFQPRPTIIPEPQLTWLGTWSVDGSFKYPYDFL